MKLCLKNCTSLPPGQLYVRCRRCCASAGFKMAWTKWTALSLNGRPLNEKLYKWRTTKGTNLWMDIHWMDCFIDEQLLHGQLHEETTSEWTTSWRDDCWMNDLVYEQLLKRLLDFRFWRCCASAGWKRAWTEWTTSSLNGRILNGQLYEWTATQWTTWTTSRWITL
jgi:hypothetical protein